MAETFGNRHPGEHRCGRSRNGPAGRRKALHHDVPALAVDVPHLRDTVVRPVECGSRRDLNGRVGAVVEVALHPGERREQALVADREADAPAGHGIGLRHRGKFDRHVDRPRHLQHRRRRLTLEIDLRIGEVGQHEDLVLLGEGHEVPIEIERRHHGGRVRRIADHHGDRLGDRMHDGAFERNEEVRRRLGRHRPDHAPGHQEPEGMDRIGRVRDQHDVARPRDGLRHVGEAFLGAQRGHHLGVGVEFDAESPPIITRLRAAQPGDALRGRVAIGPGFADRLDQLVHHMLGRGQIRIAHAEIDDIGTGVARCGLQAIDLLEHVGRQTADAMKIGHDLKCPGEAMQRRKIASGAATPCPRKLPLGFDSSPVSEWLS